MSNEISQKIIKKVKRLINEIESAQHRKNFTAFDGLSILYFDIRNLIQKYLPESSIAKIVEKDPIFVSYGTPEFNGSTNLSTLKSRMILLSDELNIDSSSTEKISEITQEPDKKNIFVVHGRNLKARDGLFTFLRSIGLNPLEWSTLIEKTGDGAPYVGDILDVAFSEAQAVIVLMTPDDQAKLADEYIDDNSPPHEKNLTPQARPNVLFEAGMAMGNKPKRTILIELSTLRPFSDVGGRHVLRMDNSTQKRQELAQRLKTAQCDVNLSGTDWHTAGNLELES